MLLQIFFSIFINNNNTFLAHAHSFSTWYMNNNILTPSQDLTSRSADNATKSSESSEGYEKESKSETYEGRYPYVAYIYLDEDDMVWRCGGTLIAPDVVLTAAHCVPKGNTFFGTVTLGGYESYNNEPQENYRIISIVRHPEYSGWTGYPNNDFAMVTLDRCAGVPPVTLHRPGQLQLLDKELYTVLGWEDTFDEHGYEKYATIRESAVYLDESCEPWRSRTSLGTMTENMICTSVSLSTAVSYTSSNSGNVLSSMHSITATSATATAASAAASIPKQGDSGGALLLKGSEPKDDIQIGVISFGYDKPGRKKPVPTVYGKLESSFSWISIASNSISQCI
jgi:secreted trypsin-like serine protease